MTKVNQQSQQLKLHERATFLLELLKKAQKRQTEFEKDLSIYRAAGPYDNIRLFSSENEILIKISRMHQVQKRIIKSYHWLIIDLYDINENFRLPLNYSFL